MKKISFTTLRSRLMFWFLLLSMLPLISGILITFRQQQQSVEQRTFEKLTAIRDLKTQRLELWLDKRMGDLQVMAGDYEIRALEHVLGENNKSAEQIEMFDVAKELLNRNSRNYNAYEEIFIIDAATGLIEMSTTEENVYTNKKRNPYFTGPLESGEIYIKDIYYSESLNRPQMTISIPIFCLQHNTHIIGVMVARINLEESLYKLLLDRTGLGKTGETLIVNKNVIALNELRNYENAPLNLKIEALPAVNAANGLTGITKTLDYRGVEILAAYTYINGTGWGFVCKQDMYELNAPVRDLVKNYAILLLFSFLLIISVVFWLIRKISKPIEEINITTQQIKGGDYTVRNYVKTGDELASLAGSINEMADSIHSRDNIQQGVASVSVSIIKHSALIDFGSALLQQLIDITDANMATFYILNEVSSEFEHFTSIGANKKLLKSFSYDHPEGEFGYAISNKEIFYLRNIPEDTIFKFRTTAGEIVPKEMMTIPVIVDNTVVALISLVNIQEFTHESFEILKLSWMTINTSYSNLLSSERTRILAENLTEINQKLEAQSEELQEQSEELQEQTEELRQSSEELQEQNVELEVQRNQVEEANRLKSEFLSNMSHELRTPLNSINALSQVLILEAKDKLNDDENSYLEIIARNGKRLLTLINSILDLSKIEAGKLEIDFQPVSIYTLLKNIKESMLQLAENKGISIYLKTKNKLPVIETDEARLHQVLLNIISNAVKFTEKGSVTISALHSKDELIIKIEDTGIGISEKILPYIFDEFRQADGSSSRQYEGTGLGLAIAKKMMKVIGGTISIKSKLGEGSVFTITLPIHANKKNISGSNIIIENTPINLTAKTSDSQKKNHLLIVEDNTDAITQMKSILQRDNYEVDIAPGGQEALDFLENTLPDGIILDLMMPDVDGFEVLEKIRNTEGSKNIPVLVLTAKDLTRADLSKLKSSNILQLIHKGDVDIQGLLDKLRMMLGEGEIKNKIGRKNPQLDKGNKGKNQNTGKSNILVVEDNLDNMLTVKAILKGKYTISEAVDGLQGLKAAKLQKPELILLDMSLPKVDGEEIIRILKEDSNTDHIPVIAVTAQAMKGDREKFLDLGCDAYVSKPIDPGYLKEEIRKLLNK